MVLKSPVRDVAVMRGSSRGSAPSAEAERPHPLTGRCRAASSLARMALVVTHRAVTAHLALDVTADAPAHLERLDLVDLRHVLHVAVAQRARERSTGGRPLTQRLHVSHVRKPHEARQSMDPDPLGCGLVALRGLDLLDLRTLEIPRRRVALQSLARPARQEEVTPHACLHRRDSRLARDGDRRMTVETGNLVLGGVNVVPEKNGLAGAIELARIGNRSWGRGRGPGFGGDRKGG